MAAGRGDRFDYCKFVELEYIPMEAGCMVSMRPTKSYGSSKSSSKGLSSTRSPDRHSHLESSPSTPRSRKRTAAGNRDHCGNASVSSSTSSSCKGSDCSPTKRNHQRYISCTDNHGIRPPPPEQYLTPLQQKEVCIRHLRARLKETVTTLQDRDTEIDELRGQLYRMQEEWVEEECHRVEAQMALKEARVEIQQLKQAVDTVRARLSDADGMTMDADVQNYFKDINAQNHKLENFLVNMELAQARLARDREAIPGCRTYAGGSAPASVSGESPGGVAKPNVAVKASCSCGNSPARSLTRSSTYTKLSDQTLPDRNGHGPDFPCLSGDATHDSGFVCSGESIPSKADLLLEAAFLSEETASLLNSYTQTLSHSLPNSLPSSLTQTFSNTLPHSFPHNLCHSLSQTLPYSYTCDKLPTGEQPMPFLCALGGMGCKSHPCLSHHHLCVHPLRETGIQTESSGVPMTGGCSYDLDTIAEQRTFRSQACSPTSTWLSDEGEEELDSITATASVTTATVMSTCTEPNLGTVPSSPPSAVACTMAGPPSRPKEGTEEKNDTENQKKSETEHVKKLCETTDVARFSDEETQVGLAGENEVTFWVESEISKLDSLKPSMEIQSRPPLEKYNNERKQGETRENPVAVEDRQEESGPFGGSNQSEAAEPGSACPQVASMEQPHTSQPRRSTSPDATVTVVEVLDENSEENDVKQESNTGNGAAKSGEPPGCDKIQKSYWSRHFLVDLLAVAIPMVPTVAWLCRNPARDARPMYHFGSLLRGCCTVALHSLRRGGGLRHYPAGGGDLGGSII